jgi:hypothetical protein
MRFLKKTENVKISNFHAHSLFSALWGFPPFLEIRNRSKKGPKNAKKRDHLFCESLFFTGANFGPFLENKTRVLRNRGASVHAHFLKNDSLPVMTVIQGGHQSETGTVFW